MHGHDVHEALTYMYLISLTGLFMGYMVLMVTVKACGPLVFMTFCICLIQTHFIIIMQHQHLVNSDILITYHIMQFLILIILLSSYYINSFMSECSELIAFCMYNRNRKLENPSCWQFKFVCLHICTWEKEETLCSILNKC